jgi:hypothetical protein
MKPVVRRSARTRAERLNSRARLRLLLDGCGQLLIEAWTGFAPTLRALVDSSRVAASSIDKSLGPMSAKDVQPAEIGNDSYSIRACS